MPHPPPPNPQVLRACYGPVYIYIYIYIYINLYTELGRFPLHIIRKLRNTNTCMLRAINEEMEQKEDDWLMKVNQLNLNYVLNLTCVDKNVVHCS